MNRRIFTLALSLGVATLFVPGLALVPHVIDFEFDS